jgi:hypothetical protein
MENNENPAGRRNRTICLPISPSLYDKTILDPKSFRKWLDAEFDRFPELFPPEMADGYLMKDIYLSKKLSIHVRRIKVGALAYGVRPAFLMPYMTGHVSDVKDPLFLRKFNVPCWALAHVFGRNSMYWLRSEQAIGRNSVVGTTVNVPGNMPAHLGADEKHTWIVGGKAYVASTVGNHCILGASVAENAGEAALAKSYGVFRSEAKTLNPDYSPRSVNIDGWKATRKAWTALFPAIAVICCFLHVFIKMRDGSKKKHRAIFMEAAAKLWECWGATTKKSFSQRIRRLVEWCEKKDAPDSIRNPIMKLRRRKADYAAAYDHPGALRSSNMIDRLMRRMDRRLFAAQYFHGGTEAAELTIRGWALIYNFAPWNPWTVKKREGIQCPAEMLNGKRYADCWLQNLLISASLGGYRSPPQNPL